MTSQLIPNVDKMRQLQQSAANTVNYMADRVNETFWLPDIERAELDEYMTLDPKAHATLLAEIGEQAYNDYVQHMERLRRQYARPVR